MSARFALFALAAVVLAAGAWFLLRDDARGNAAHPMSHAEAPLDLAPEALQLEPQQLDVEQRSVVDLGAPSAEPSATQASVATATASDVEGTLWIEHARGIREPAARARFELYLRSSVYVERVHVEVCDGQWSADIPDRLESKVTGLEILALWIGDRAAVLREPRESISFPTSGPVELVAYLPDSTTLRVIGADTGLELGNVDIVPIGDDLEAHPGPDYERRAIAAHARSPVEVLALGAERELGVRQLCVHAPGYAWTIITLDSRVGGERTVTLQPGGSLRLTLSGKTDSSAVQLRFRRADTRLVLSTPVGRAHEILLDGFEAGSMSITAEIGEEFDDPIELGRVETEIIAGGEARATLAISPAPKPEWAAAAGVVVVPREWMFGAVSVSLDFLGTRLDGSHDSIDIDVDDPTREPNGDLVYAWSHPQLQVGRYEFEVHQPSWSTVIEVPPGGRLDFRIELPPPAQVTVRVVDAMTGEDVDTSVLWWNCPMPDGVDTTGLEDAAFDPKTKTFTLRCPAGPIELSPEADGYESTIELVTVVPGQQEITLEIGRATEVVIVLRDGDAAVPFPDDWIAMIETEDGELVDTSESSSPSLRSYHLPGGGRYRFKFSAINGYQPIEDRMVDIEESKSVKLEIALQRIR